MRIWFGHAIFYFGIMRFIVPLLVLAAALSLTANARIQLRIDGAEKGLVRSWPKQVPADSAAALEWVQNRLESLGYFRRKVQAGSADGLVTIKAVAGPRSRLASIEFRENRAFPADALARQSGLRSGVFFDAAQIQSAADRILQFYEDRGYPFCRIAIASIEPADSGVRIVLAINENGQYFIRDIRIEGSSQTRGPVVHRELKLAPGDTFCQSRVNMAAIRLRRLGWFDAVSEPRLEAHSRRRWVDVVFPVSEGKGIFAEGTVGYQEQDERDPWTGALRIDARNILGTGRKGRLGVRKDFDYSLFELGYTEPWILGRRFDGVLDLRMEFERERSSLLRAGLSLRFPLNDQWSATARVERREISEIALRTSAKSWGAGTGLERNTLDLAWNPTRGSRIGTEVLGYRKHSESGGAMQEWRGKAWTEAAISLLRPWVGYLYIEGLDLHSANSVLLRSELFHLGGTQSVRGYYENQFAFEKAVWGNAELRLLPQAESRIFVFLDAAYGTWRELSSTMVLNRKETLWGYGVGMRMATRLGIMGIDLSLGRDTPWRRAKVHAQLRTTL